MPVVELFILLGTGITIGFLSGLHTSSPQNNLGHVYWPAWIALSVTSIGMAQAGAITAHKVSAKWLSYIFIVLIFYISLDILGAINWIAGHL